MASPEDIQKALLAFNNGGGLKKFSKEAKSKALAKKKDKKSKKDIDLGWGASIGTGKGWPKSVK